MGSVPGGRRIYVEVSGEPGFAFHEVRQSLLQLIRAEKQTVGNQMRVSGEPTAESVRLYSVVLQQDRIFSVSVTSSCSNVLAALSSGRNFSRESYFLFSSRRQIRPLRETLGSQNLPVNSSGAQRRLETHHGRSRMFVYPGKRVREQ